MQTDWRWSKKADRFEAKTMIILISLTRELQTINFEGNNKRSIAFSSIDQSTKLTPHSSTPQIE